MLSGHIRLGSLRPTSTMIMAFDNFNWDTCSPFLTPLAPLATNGRLVVPLLQSATLATNGFLVVPLLPSVSIKVVMFFSRRSSSVDSNYTWILGTA